MGFETETVLLFEKEVKFCNHWEKCLKEKECPIKDDAKGIFEKPLKGTKQVLAAARTWQRRLQKLCNQSNYVPS